MEIFYDFWDKHKTIIMLFLIRVMEVFASSIVPSFISVLLVFVNVQQKTWDLVTILSFVGFSLINFHFLLKYIAGRNNKTEFFILNSIVYGIYCAASIAIFQLRISGFMIYSLMFANLRVFEIFGWKTIQSIYVSNIIIIVSMVLFGIYAYNHTQFIRKLMKINGVDDIEIEYEEYVPTQNDQEVEILTIDDVDRNMLDEVTEYEEAVKKSIESIDDYESIKGQGETVFYVEPENPDNDIDEADYVAENAEQINKNAAYDSDSLWEDHIYEKTADGKPIRDYTEEEQEEAAKEPEIEKLGIAESVYLEFMSHLRSVTKKARVKINYYQNENTMAHEDEQQEQQNEEEMKYDADTLWEDDFYQGSSSDNIAEHTDEIDDDDIAQQDQQWLEDYDENSLWDIDGDYFEDDEDDQEVYMNDDYDPDSLWSKDFKQGRDN